MKTDFYTKAVLTVIAVFLGIIAFQNVDFVTKAHATPVEIKLPALNEEKAEINEEKEITFFIYENSKIERPFTKDGYSWEKRTCRIGADDTPSHIITNVKPEDKYGSYVEIKRAK